MRFQIFKFGIVMAGAAASLNAQWLNYPEPGTPLTLDGKPDLVAKTPRASNGRPDLSGVWQIEPPAPGEIERLYGKSEVSYVAGDDVRDVSRYFANLFIDFKPGEEPIMPAAAVQTLRNRQKRNLLDNPTAHCLPYGLPNRYFAARPFKILQTPEAVAMFFEVDGAFRQIHTDGRKLPVDPFPAWLGYSAGTWAGDTLVVETAGFNDRTWLDAGGHPHSEALKFRNVSTAVISATWTFRRRWKIATV